MSYVMGLDLGQSGDPTAIAIAELVEPPTRPTMDVPAYPTAEQLRELTAPERRAAGLYLRHLERIALNTPYPAIVERVVRMVTNAPLKGRVDLVVDATGVGRPVVDMFRAAGLDLTAVTITSGNAASGDGRDWRVPKRDLVVGLQVLLQEGRLKIAKGLPEADALVQELLAFKVKIDATTAHDSYNAREGAHDDLVLAAAMACWKAGQGAGAWFV